MPLSVGTAARRRTQVVDAVGGNFGDVCIVPSGGRGIGDSSVPAILVFHGALGSAGVLATNSEPYTSFLHELCDRVGQPFYLVNTGDTWGNDAGNTLVSTGVSAAGTMFGNSTTAPTLIGLSMGATTMFRYARTHAVTKMVGVEPVCNITDIHTNNRGTLTSNINGAYGGAYSQATYGAAHNPQTMAAAGTFDTYPVLIQSGSGDAICIPAETATMLTSLDLGVGYQTPGVGHGFIADRRFARTAEQFITDATIWARQTVVSGGFTYDLFHADSTYTAPGYPVTVDVLLVGGGGPGGVNGTGGGDGGGGGGGEVVELTGVTVSGPESVVVGRGGFVASTAAADANGVNGEASSFGAHGTAIGGGAGGWRDANGATGGCGGGGGSGATRLGGAATGSGGNGADGSSSQSGGGGGASNGDAVLTTGGNGKTSTIDPFGRTFGGGGGGGVSNGTGDGLPGTGGGGIGGLGPVLRSALDGESPLGGGGGGQRTGTGPPGWGGWGTVIVKRAT